MKFKVSLNEEILRETEKIRDLEAKIIEGMKKKGLPRFGRAQPSKVAIQHLQIEYEGAVYALSDPFVKTINRTDWVIIPPTDLSSLSDEAMASLLQYFTAEEVWLVDEMAELELRRRIRKSYMSELTNIVRIALLGEKNARTGKAYTEPQRKEEALKDSRVKQATIDWLEADSIFKMYEASYKNVHSIVESINRLRMFRDMESRSQQMRGKSQQWFEDGHSGQIRTPPPRDGDMR